MKEKSSKIMPLCLLKKGGRFLFPSKGKDLIFEVDYRTEDTIIVKNETTSKKWFPLETMVFVPLEEEEKLRQYATFDDLFKRTPFEWENYSYLKISNREAIRMSPIVGTKKELLTFAQSQEQTGRLPLIAEVEGLPFVPPLTRVLTMGDMEESKEQEKIMFWYPIKKFSDKTVVSLEWI